MYTISKIIYCESEIENIVVFKTSDIKEIINDIVDETIVIENISNIYKSNYMHERVERFYNENIRYIDIEIMKEDDEVSTCVSINVAESYSDTIKEFRKILKKYKSKV